MDKLVLPFLSKLSKEASGRYGNAALKKSADDAIALLTNSNPTLVSADEGIFPCLQLACTSKQAKFMVPALDCLEKLLAFRLLAQNSVSAQTSMIKTIGQCADMQDDAVQLQVVKAMLTAVSTGVAHESNLLLALRACYHIHLVSDNAVNRTTAKISLTQMINYLFEKDRGNPQYAQEGAASGMVSIPPSPRAAVTDAAPPVVVVEAGEERIEGMYQGVQAALGYEFQPRAKEAAAAVATEAEEAIAPPPPPPQASGQLEFASVSYKNAFLVLRTLSKLSMKAISFEDMNFGEDAAGDEEDRRADPRALKSKLLSLELLSQAIATGSGMLKQSDALLFAIKQYLFPALMKNCMEVNLQVASLAVKVFEQILVEFKTCKLKKEMELLISTVFLAGLLDSPHAAFESRQLICESLNRICANLQLLTELFLNYDCDLHSKGLLKTMVESLHRIAISPSQQAEARKLAKLAATCLSTLAKTLCTSATQLTEAPASASSPLTSGEDIAEEVKSASIVALNTFQQKQAYEKELKQGIAIFNVDKKPSKAIAYWREKRLIEDNAGSLAQFLLTNSNILSKTQIGEVLGGDSEEHKEILSAYVRLFDFANQQIDQAIRTFLSHFRLPGEAQKVDRIFENFASRYWGANKTEFPNADCAFVLSFAIIMLQTDAHNPNIRPERKMTKQDFLKNNRGIASGRDMSAEFLGGIYDRIVANAITMKGEDLDYASAAQAAAAAEDSKDARLKRRAFFKQREEILRSATATNKTSIAANGSGDAAAGAGSEDLVYYQVEAASPEHVAAMFSLVWEPMRDALVACFLGTEDTAVATICLEGVFNCARTACRFQMSEERDDLLQGLAQLTKLAKPSEIQPKHVLCIQALVTLAVSEANYLGTGWFPLLHSVSELARLLAMNANGQDDSEQQQQVGEFTAKQQQLRPELKAVVLLKRAMDISTIDRIFLGSEMLSETAVVDFVHALTLVSREELGLDSGMNKSRVFSLQKLVEVADVNLAKRGRVCWGKMWATLGEHFYVSGCHPSVKVALYAVDSLKQLSLKFLNREEFVGFNFQDAFLRPFERIELKSTSTEVRSLVLSCMQLFVVSKSKTIKSGWGAVFDVIAASALMDDSNARFGFSVLDLCPKYNAPKNLFALCALKFAKCKHVDICAKCFAIVEQYCATKAYLAGEEEPRLVFSLVQEFCFSETRADIQRASFHVILTTFRNAMEERAAPAMVLELFRSFLSQWKNLATFDSLAHVVQETTLLVIHIIYDAAEQLPPQQQPQIKDGMAPAPAAAPQSKREMVYLPVLQAWLEFAAQQLLGSQVQICVVNGVHTFDLLLKRCTALFSIQAWMLILENARGALEATSPALLSSAELLQEFRLVGGEEEEERGKLSLEDVEKEEGGVIPTIGSRRSSMELRTPLPPTFDATKARARAHAHLGLVRLVSKLRVKELQERLAQVLESVLKDASAFNDYHALRVELGSRNFSFPHEQGLPDALEVEVLSAMALLAGWLRGDNSSGDSEARFERVVELVLHRYLRQDRILAAETTLFVRGLVETVGSSKSTGSERELAALTPVVLIALRSVLDMDKKEAVNRTLKWAFPLLLELIECPNRDVRAVVKKILEKHVSVRLAL